MVKFLRAAAFLEIVVGTFFLIRGKNEIHVVLGSLAVGFAIVTAALASILDDIRGSSAARRS